MRTFSTFVAIAALVALALAGAVAGCGGKGSPPPDDTATTSSDTGLSAVEGTAVSAAGDAAAATSHSTAPVVDTATVAAEVADGPKEVKGLKTVAAFAGIADAAARSKALFTEAAKVLQHPRCTNCHPAGESPTQGDMMRAHEPPVVRGMVGFGVVGMECMTCHTPTNVELGDRSVPGSPAWRLAPASMAWQGVVPGAICEQLKDKARNGGRDLAAIVEHVRRDALVAWGWRPGSGRSAAPGDQAVFADLVEAWTEAGAHCP